MGRFWRRVVWFAAVLGASAGWLVLKEFGG
jgi:hypothetical protein